MRKSSAKEKDRKHQGDILGISDAGPSSEIPPMAGADRPVRGIEVGQPATGFGDVPANRAGATGIDMGGGGEGSDVEMPEASRSGEVQRRRREDEEA